MYRLNKETLRYERIEESRWQKLVRFLGKLFILSIFAILANLALFSFVPAIQETKLAGTQQNLIDQYKTIKDSLTAIEYLISAYKIKDDELYRPILELEPLSEEIRTAGHGGVDKYAELFRLPSSKLIINTSVLADNLSSQLNVQKSSYETIVREAHKKDKIINCRPAIQPISVEDFTRISGIFGIREIHPVTGQANVRHTGIDLAGPRAAMFMRQAMAR
ncbi:MAG: hypothetical protein HC896_01260 [Bacteroidales bacterium]|nr:hypothetical protein [Bacteroidales bacterium]